MIEARMNFRGDRQFIPRMVKRTKGKGAEPVLRDWSNWIRNKRIIRMYRDQGTVRGEQGRWAKLSKWTVEQKGSRRRMLSKKGYQFGAMVRSYKITWRRRGLRAWSFLMENVARSKGGFDYPSALHSGWGQYAVNPKKPDGKLAWKIASGDWRVFAYTFPGPTPARPHIKFFRKDSRVLMRTMARWIFSKARKVKVAA